MVDKPIVIHSREAEADTWCIMKKYAIFLFKDL